MESVGSLGLTMLDNAVSRGLGDFAYLSGLTGLRLSCPHAVDTAAPR